MNALMAELAGVVLLGVVAYIALHGAPPRIFWLVLLAVYCLDVIAITLLGRASSAAAKTAHIPGNSLLWVWSVGWEYSAKYTARQIIGNVILFIPAGMLFPTMHSDRPWKAALTGAGALSLLIETAQYLSHLGTFETDDLIFNIWGALIGAGIYLNVKDSAKDKLPVGKAIRRLIPALAFALTIAAACTRPLYRKYFG